MVFYCLGPGLCALGIYQLCATFPPSPSVVSSPGLWRPTGLGREVQTLPGKVPKLVMSIMRQTCAQMVGQCTFQSIMFPKRSLEFSIYKWQNHYEGQRKVQLILGSSGVWSSVQCPPASWVTAYPASLGGVVTNAATSELKFCVTSLPHRTPAQLWKCWKNVYRVSVPFLFFLLPSGATWSSAVHQGSSCQYWLVQMSSLYKHTDTSVCIPLQLKICQRRKALSLSPQTKIRCLISKRRSKHSTIDSVNP